MSEKQRRFCDACYQEIARDEPFVRSLVNVKKREKIGYLHRRCKDVQFPFLKELVLTANPSTVGLHWRRTAEIRPFPGEVVLIYDSSKRSPYAFAEFKIMDERWSIEGEDQPPEYNPPYWCALEPPGG